MFWTYFLVISNEKKDLIREIKPGKEKKKENKDKAIQILTNWNIYVLLYIMGISLD